MKPHSVSYICCMSLLLNRYEFGSPENAGKIWTKKECDALLSKWVLNPKLRLHMNQVGHLMEQWAIQKECLDQAGANAWYMAGVLHDADWDQWPDQHCQKIIAYLENEGIDPTVLRAIASHGPRHFGVYPQTRMDQMLYALDELSGLIHAYSLLRPQGYEGMEVSGVKKRLKEKTFAANVSREEIDEACAMANVAKDDLIAFIIQELKSMTDFTT